jgi:1-deoxy-D-xylulose-5-phosphate reductoisomerase
MREIVILGSTGSIGRQALEVFDHLGLRAAALTGNRNVKLLEEQARR